MQARFSACRVAQHLSAGTGRPSTLANPATARGWKALNPSGNRALMSGRPSAPVFSPPKQNTLAAKHAATQLPTPRGALTNRVSCLLASLAWLLGHSRTDNQSLLRFLHPLFFVSVVILIIPPFVFGYQFASPSVHRKAIHCRRASHLFSIPSVFAPASARPKKLHACSHQSTWKTPSRGLSIRSSLSSQSTSALV